MGFLSVSVVCLSERLLSNSFPLSYSRTKRVFFVPDATRNAVLSPNASKCLFALSGDESIGKRREKGS